MTPEVLSILPHRLRDTATRVVNALLPASCLLCGGNSGTATLCPGCAADLPRLTENLCPQCAEPTSRGERCGACLHDPPDFERTFAACCYDFPADRLIQALKYGHQLAPARWFGNALATLPGIANHDLVVPLPLHPERLRQRGFNQAAEIARPIARATGIRLDTASLSRTRPTPAQAALPLKARRTNVRGAFACSHDLAGLRILLVDDVMTTGATARECARILKLHGAAAVSVAVAARAVRI
ncbi:MAG: ComF family protein [Betaproteobacteria bacterium]|nr:ComF family protein [Betaproteobacteria bacterium]